MKNKSIFIYIIVFLLTCILPIASVFATDNRKNNDFKNQIIVKYKVDTSDKNKKDKKDKKAFKENKKIKSIKSFKNSKVHEIIELNDASDYESVAEEITKDSDVEYVQPNYGLSSLLVDENTQQQSLSKMQWTINGSVSDEGVRSGIDMNVLRAWDITKGNPNVVIGILDSGVDISHPDLINSIYRNSSEIAGNGIDDDGNGYIDDISGWDFVNNRSAVYNTAEDDKHGTIMVGIISANGKMGFSGIAPNVKILPLKFISNGIGYTSDAIEAIEYAKKMGVKIINCSFGSDVYNKALFDEMKDSNILFVCAAGNYKKDVKLNPIYPACFELDNVISVGAIDDKGKAASFSNYGIDVDVSAPGVNVLSTAPDSKFELYKGTSISAAHVTGIAALLKSKEENLSASQIKARILNNVVVSNSLKGINSTQGRVDAYATLANVVPTPDLSGDVPLELKQEENGIPQKEFYVEMTADNSQAHV